MQRILQEFRRVFLCVFFRNSPNISFKDTSKNFSMSSCRNSFKNHLSGIFLVPLQIFLQAFFQISREISWRISPEIIPGTHLEIPPEIYFRFISLLKFHKGFLLNFLFYPSSVFLELFFIITFFHTRITLKINSWILLQTFSGIQEIFIGSHRKLLLEFQQKIFQNSEISSKNLKKKLLQGLLSTSFKNVLQIYPQGFLLRFSRRFFENYSIDFFRNSSRGSFRNSFRYSFANTSRDFCKKKTHFAGN